MILHKIYRFFELDFYVFPVKVCILHQLQLQCSPYQKIKGLLECLYVCSAPVLVGCNVFWIFVLIMLLNTKSFLIVTKQLGFLFAQKSINNLPHQMFF